MFGSYPRRLWAPDYPWGEDPEERYHFIEQCHRDWGTDIRLGTRAPSLVHDERFRDWWATYLRMSASPGAATALTRMNMEIDIRHILPAIRVPTLILHRAGDRALPAAGSRFMAERIPGARYVELPGDDHFPFVGDQDVILGEVEHFLTGIRPAPEANRVLATVMSAEINAAAATAVRLGDRRWSEARADYDALMLQAVDRFHGREAMRTVDGGLAVFDGPARAVRCAEEIVRQAQGLGLQARAGLHTGEVVVGEQGTTGATIHLATQVAAQATAGEILVSSTVKDLVVGSGLDFQSLGDRVFPGLPGEWRLYRLASEAPASRPTTRIHEQANEPDAAHPMSILSPREREVLRLLVAGRSDREIAERLFISSRTASKHVGNILAKLDVGSRAEAAVRAVQDDLL
jgi:class 3 adenylate cyclase/DNA-binding CsgD family transcriptional regulator